MPQTAVSSESISARHARLYDRRNSKHSALDSVGWVVASVLIIGALVGGLWFLAG